jgi:hypothetical protein
VRTGDRIIAMLCCAVVAASVTGTRITMAREMDPSLAAPLDTLRALAAAAAIDNDRHPGDQIPGVGIAGAIRQENTVSDDDTSALLRTLLPWAVIPFVAIAVFFKWIYRGNSSNPDDDSMGTVI